MHDNNIELLIYSHQILIRQKTTVEIPSPAVSHNCNGELFSIDTVNGLTLFDDQLNFIHSTPIQRKNLSNWSDIDVDYFDRLIVTTDSSFVYFNPDCSEIDSFDLNKPSVTGLCREPATGRLFVNCNEKELFVFDSHANH